MPAARPLVLALAALVAACAQPAASPAPSSTAAPTLVAVGSASPGVTLPVPIPSASPAHSPRSQPPDALLATGGGAAIKGKLGTWTLPTAGSDAPWQPASTLSAVTVTPGARITVRFADTTRIGTWQAVYAAATETDGLSLKGLGDRAAETPPLDTITLDPAPSGAWVVAVRLGLVDGGSATYYWLINAS